MKAFRLAVAALIASSFVSVGCSHNSKQVRDSFDGMIGHSEAELIRALGPPNWTASDGDDGTVLIWDQYHDLGLLPGLGVSVSPLPYALVGLNVPPRELGYVESVMFYVHPDGTVYYWRIQKS